MTREKAFLNVSIKAHDFKIERVAVASRLAIHLYKYISPEFKCSQLQG